MGELYHSSQIKSRQIKGSTRGGSRYLIARRENLYFAFPAIPFSFCCPILS